MTRRTTTGEQIRWVGLEALVSKLGAVGAVRFLQQFESGRGDYSKQRGDWLQKLDVEALAETVRQRSGADSK